jgi:hypothetical protein
MGMKLGVSVKGKAFIEGVWETGCWGEYLDLRGGRNGTMDETACEEFRNFYSSPYIIRVIKSNKSRWAWLVARILKMRSA